MRRTNDLMSNRRPENLSPTHQGVPGSSGGLCSQVVDRFHQPPSHQVSPDPITITLAKNGFCFEVIQPPVTRGIGFPIQSRCDTEKRLRRQGRTGAGMRQRTGPGVL
ncbi:MAG: hypothetical protein Ct9H300mP1_15810 [Planctomycetaceae bacterium]|nr:MAG: hypothetical protein Ct9H300mP1_15810 [Planctomycetaceae bacterium]